MIKKLLITAAIVAASLISIGCTSEADLASQNVSKAADQFEVPRRIVFYNGITGEYILVINGLCSLGNSDRNREITVTCKTGPGQYKKHFLGLSDNVTFVAEQTEAIPADPYQYRVVFKPLSLIPNIQITK